MKLIVIIAISFFLTACNSAVTKTAVLAEQIIQTKQSFCAFTTKEARAELRKNQTTPTDICGDLTSLRQQ